MLQHWVRAPCQGFRFRLGCLSPHLVRSPRCISVEHTLEFGGTEYSSLARTLAISPMCILLSSTEHSEYPFILCSNRDEFFNRPTAAANFRELGRRGARILSPLDMARPEHGTWIGVTTEGKLAVLVNYREADTASLFSEISRGVIPLDYLGTDRNTTAEEWVANLENSVRELLGPSADRLHPLLKIGGFLLLYGQLSLTDAKIGPLNILSNRGDKGKVHVPAGSATVLSEDTENQTTFGLSNSLYYNPWPKVIMGQRALLAAIKSAVAQNSPFEELVDACFGVLSQDTFDRAVATDKLLSFNEKTLELRNSVFVPPLELGIDTPIAGNRTIGRYYGTRTQTVILLHKLGELHYFEKNLHNSDDLADGSTEARHFHFTINQDQDK